MTSLRLFINFFTYLVLQIIIAWTIHTQPKKLAMYLFRYSDTIQMLVLMVSVRKVTSKTWYNTPQIISDTKKHEQRENYNVSDRWPCRSMSLI